MSDPLTIRFEFFFRIQHLILVYPPACRAALGSLRTDPRCSGHPPDQPYE